MAGEDFTGMRYRPIDPGLPGTRIHQEVQANDNSFVLQGDVYNSYNLQAPSRETWQVLSECQQEREQRDKYELLVGSLKFPYMSARLLNVESSLSNTCEWLFSHADFIRWVDDRATSQHHGFLWIKGKPGSGKSIIMKHLHDHTKNHFWSDQIVISYFFNARAKGELEKSSLDLYRSLVHQLLRKVSACKDMFLQRFQDKEYKGVVEEWTTNELKAFLFDTVTSTEHPAINIFIDALDEGDEEDVRQMIEYLQRLAATASSSSIQLRTCLSSRHYPQISIRKGITMVLENQNGHKNDIQCYVRDNVYPELLSLQQEICEKSAGIFLWIVLVVRTLNAEIDQGGDIQKTKKLLISLPADLNTVFQGVLSKNSDNMKECITLLRWVLCSRRMLRLQELYIAVKYSFASKTFNLDILRDEARLRRWLLYQSRGLVELAYNGRRFEEDDRSPDFGVQFIHETVRTFLLGPVGIASFDLNLRASIRGPSEEMMKNVCFIYIKRCTSRYDRADPFSIAGVRTGKPGGRTALLNKLPFVAYASHYLLSHAEAASFFVSQREFLQAFKDSRELEAWYCTQRTLFDLEHTDIRWTSYSFKNPALSLLPILVEHNLPRLVQCLIELGADINAVTTTRGSALHIACLHVNMEITQLLIEQGANIEAEDSSGQTPITSFINFIAIDDIVVSTDPYADLVLLLLQHGASVPPPTLVRAIALAAECKSLPLLRLLLEKGGDPNATNEQGDTMLYLAGAQPQAVDLLLAHGADLNAPCGMYGNVLQAAWYRGDARKVEIFLGSGADVNFRDREHGSLLQAAVVRGRENLVKMFLHAGADVNCEGGQYGSALKAAVHHFDYAIEKLLLDHGATPNNT